MDIRCFIISQKHVFVKAIFEKTVQMPKKFQEKSPLPAYDAGRELGRRIHQNLTLAQ
jgi:hypothetical protein